MKKLILSVALIAAIAGGFWLASAPAADAGPPIPNCNNLCQHVYNGCIADGWQPAECESKRQMCLNDCFNGQPD